MRDNKDAISPVSAGVSAEQTCKALPLATTLVSGSYKHLSYQVTLSASVFLNLRNSNMFGEVRFDPVEGA